MTATPNDGVITALPSSGEDTDRLPRWALILDAASAEGEVL